MRRWIRITVALLVALYFADGRGEGASPSTDDKAKPKPLAAGSTLPSYEKRELEGWTIYVHRDFERGGEADQKLRERTLALLRVKLYDIARVVPDKPLAELRKIPIWVERKSPRFPCMCYHVSPEWLGDHGFDPAKAGAVELANPETFLTWTQAQPSMVLHELAHGYHDRVLKHGHRELRACFDRAAAAKTYEKVLHYDGRTVRHYALNNDQEFFAEATEAFFGTNDFFPFVRPELAAHDPDAFRLLQKIWEGK
ncbi:MAG: metallopeptidase [Pirellulales bacterium]